MENMQNEIRWLLQEKYPEINPLDLNGASAAVKRDIKRLRAGEPVDFVIGFSEFLGCKIDLSKKPLIPRVETEFWTEQAIEELKIKDKGLKIRVLDIFSGSGAIGIAVAKQLNTHTGMRVSCVFADSEKNCIEQIKINCKKNKLPAGSYKVVQSDVFSNVRGKFDYIFANPPYIPTKMQKAKGKIQNSVMKYEPHAALFGGGDGLQYIRRFLAEAKNRLNKSGRIFMEFDPQQKSAITKLSKKFGYSKIEFHKDQYNKWRWITLGL